VKSKQKSGKSKQKHSFCLDFRLKTFKPGNPNNKKTDFLFGFPEFSKESGKSKHKNIEIQTIIRDNPNKKAFFYLFGFPGF
jgi:hypothetical protein